MFDDFYTMNTQSSTQWDGMRHVRLPGYSLIEPALTAIPVFSPRNWEFLQWRKLSPSDLHIVLTRSLYQVKGEDILGPESNSKCGIHAWAQHGIVARGVLLDFATYAEAHGISINHYENDKISHATLVEVGKSQGIDIRPESQGGDIKVGDVLLIRSGFLKNYRSIDTAERIEKHSGLNAHGSETRQRYAGVEQSEEILDWFFIQHPFTKGPIH